MDALSEDQIKKNTKTHTSSGAEFQNNGVKHKNTQRTHVKIKNRWKKENTKDKVKSTINDKNWGKKHKNT